MAEVEVALEEVQQDEEIVEETIAPVKSVKSVEAAPPGNIFDIFKPKDDAAKDAAKDGEKPEDKPADAAADATKPADKTPEAKPNIFDVFKPKTDAGAKTEDPKPLFPANDLFNFKKNAEEAQKAFKEKGLGGWIATVQQNVQATLNALIKGGEGKKLVEAIIEWIKNLIKTVQEKGMPAVMKQVEAKLKEILARAIVENNKWPMKALTQK